jgi:outer membrane protein assembly factor BamD
MPIVKILLIKFRSERVIFFIIFAPMFLKRSYILLFFIGLVSLSACHRDFTKLQKNGTIEEKYKAAVKYYQGKDYYRSGILFEEIVPLLKGDSLAENAQFYNAYCNYHQGLYSMSSYLFKQFYSTYANSSYAEEAYYMYAYSMYKDAPQYNLDQTNTLTAVDALQTFINSFPESKYAENCNKSLIDLRKRLELKAYEKAKLYYKTKDYNLYNLKSAVVAVDNFKKDFPDSDYNEELAFMKIQSQSEFAKNSFEHKQKERYSDVLKFYEEFIDKYPKSKYLKNAEKSYEEANKGIERIAKLEKEAKEREAKEKEAKTKAKEENNEIKLGKTK